MRTLNVHETKTNLSALLAEIERTRSTFVICRNGEPVANLVPHAKRSRLTPDPFLSQVKIRGDLTEPTAMDEWEDL